MKRDPIASDSGHLVYREKGYPIFGIPLLCLGLFFLVKFLSSCFAHELDDLPPLIGEDYFWANLLVGLLTGSFFIFFIIWVGWLMCRSGQLVFDKTQRKVTKTIGFLQWSYSKTYSFDDFDTATWKSQATAGGSISEKTYSVTLVGPRHKMKVFETPQQKVAEKDAREIAVYLGIELKQEFQMSARSSVLMLTVMLIVWCPFGTMLILFGLYMLVSDINEVLSGQTQIGGVISGVAFSCLFVVLAIVIFVLGIIFLRSSLRQLKEEEKQEQEPQATQERD